ncbi:hypothetical protein OH460_09250 [Vibrio sp. Makdt]|uniref:hypothetical protein n=1 Tax=Vibrio sp. Makdt TaxID=2998828 RepID=UPI0022CD35AC|nr:hypothetical protein [Vibrio sp. Makdt]MDA0152489.1 hypothetical protein [Vibrio sp. Makdt]
MKKKLLGSIMAVGIVVGGFVAAKTVSLNHFNSALINTPAVNDVVSDYTIKNGALFIESIVTDFDGFQWQSITKVDLGDEGLMFKLTTKAFAIDKTTAEKYYNWISATNNSLNAIAETSVSLGNVHSDIRFKPIQLNTPTGQVTIPETAVIIDNSKGSSSIVIAALGEMEVDAVGNKTTFVKPRLRYQPSTTSDGVIYSVKFDSVKVGLLEISKATTVDFALLPEPEGKFNLGIDARIEKIANINDFSSRIVMDNLTESTLSNLGNAAYNAFATDLATKVSNMTTLFDYAKAGGAVSLKLDAVDDNGTPLKVEANLGFDEQYRKGITTNDAFSIVTGAELDANLVIPIDLAVTTFGAEWTSKFISDGMVKLKDKQLETVISVRNMDATVNGNTFNL